MARIVSVVVVVAVLAAACSDGGDRGGGGRGLLSPDEPRPDGITVTSPAFRDGGAIPERYTCEDEGVPPPLRWQGVPAGTAELAVVLEDPDAPDGVFVHWLLVGIDPAVASVEPGAPPPGRALPGSSDNPTYIGPCPPDDGGAHRYYFQVYAFDAPPAVPEGGDPAAVARALRRAATAGGVLMGTFER